MQALFSEHNYPGWRTNDRAEIARMTARALNGAKAEKVGCTQAMQGQVGMLCEYQLTISSPDGRPLSVGRYPRRMHKGSNGWEILL
jgi:hypothetical protein